MAELKNNKITINGIRIYANHGVYDFEKENGQEFILDIVIFTKLQKAMTFDNLEYTINYAKVTDYAVDFLKNNTFDLIEKAAYELSKEILAEFKDINAVELTLHKPNAPVDHSFQDISVNITNKWNTAVLSIGSNIGKKEEYIELALCKLKDSRYIKNIKVSDIIVTKPYGYVEQDDFLNGAVIFETSMNPYDLLKYINEIEKDAHRERVVHWGPRTLDLDIVFYNDLLLDDEILKIPHIDMQNRDFVLKPLMELCPEYLNVRTNLTVRQMYDILNDK